ncbi:MAG: polyphosphate polymerase domain-containing protein [Planctomycetota bacterium]|jgi:hypothetical protein
MDDAVTSARREVKFAFADADAEKLATVLEVNARPVAFGRHRVSAVHSLYFDDHRLSAARESLDGVGRRIKLRLRWYDEPLPSTRAFFEIKHRRGTAITKERFPLRLAGDLSSFDLHELRDRLVAALPARAGTLLMLRPDPTVIVTYRRRHFRDPESGARLTVDWDIRGDDQLGRRRLRRRFPVPLSGVVVLEAKAAAVDERRIQRLIHPLKPRVTRMSKYVQCCMEMGWGQLVT